MTSEMKTYIEQIGAKSRQLHQLLVIERERAHSMQEEISRLKEFTKQQDEEVRVLQLEILELKTQLTEEREQVQIQTVSANEVDIDGLVKEIDFCIQQLKIANE